MRDREGTKQDVLSNQERMLRLAKRDYGITAKVIAAETGIPLPTVESWRRSNAPVAMALADFVLVCRVIPDELTSLVLEPSAKHVGTDENGEGDFDVLHRETAHFGAEKLEAEADGVITHIEKAGLQHRARRIAAVARKAAA